MSDEALLSIQQVAERTGVAQPTLRMWETRYGFPVPRRMPSGHRRYGDDDVELIRQVVAERDAGLSLPAAIERVRAAEHPAESSIFAGLRRRRPDLTPYVLPKRTLLGLSHAIEDECCARAERPLLFGSFQREPFYRHAEQRWRELARTAELAVVFADFPERSAPGEAPVELPLADDAPLGREWSLVCEAPDYAAALAAWERPGQNDVTDRDRVFETIWTVEPGLVREAARVAVGIMEGTAPDLAARATARLETTAPPNPDQMRLVAALTSRMVAYVGAPTANGLPAPSAAPRG